MDPAHFNPAPGAGKRVIKPPEGADARSVYSITGAKDKSEKEKLEILAREFESIFVHQMIKSMRSTVEKSELTGGGPGEEMFTDMLDEEMARQIAFAQRDGLSSALVAQLTSMMDGKESGAGAKQGEDQAASAPANSSPADKAGGR